MSKNIENLLNSPVLKKNLLKALYIALFLAISYGLILITLFIVLFQFIFSIIFSKPNEFVLTFSKSMSIFAYEIILFLTYNTDQMPFPFRPWPKHSTVLEVFTKE